MSDVSAPVQIGDILADKYRVDRVLGMGAMGVVVAAMHVDLQEMRAIKFMLPSMLSDAAGVERFLREARAAARLKSQHVAKVHDVGRLATGAPYIVMEYLEGADLKSVLGTRGTLPIPEAVTHLMQACEALAEAHGFGIVHRDLKPANLFITTGPTGAPCAKILDFGIAKVNAGQGPAMDMTRTTELLGTPLYMSPEQMRSTRNVDARSDLWALGVILYRMLTGKTPFTGSTVTEICSAVIADTPDAPATLRADLPPGLDAIVMRCLEKSPAKRFASAAELSAALAPFREEAAPRPIAKAEPTIPRGGLGRTVVMDPLSGAAPPTAAPVAPIAPRAPVPSAPVVAPLIAATPAPIAPPLPPAAMAPRPPIASTPEPVVDAPRAPLAGTVTLDPPLDPAPQNAASAALPGQITARASTWTQSGPTVAAAPAPRARTSLAIGAMAAVFVLVGAFAAVRMRHDDPSRTPLAAVSVSASATSPEPGSSAAPSVAPTAPPGPTATATAVVAAPVATPTASPLPNRPRVAPTPSHGKDAFGNDRR